LKDGWVYTVSHFEEGPAQEPHLGIKPSKKFANGTIHENGSGQFKILDRYLENNIIMLKYQWLSGENEGKTDVNKEINVNASIWKFKKVRGLVGNSQKNEGSHDEFSLQDVMDRLDSTFDHFDKLQEQMHSLQKQLKDMNEHIHSLVKNYELTNKLIDKM
jgi:chaperonin cofactor prefoldin